MCSLETSFLKGGIVHFSLYVLFNENKPGFYGVAFVSRSTQRSGIVVFFNRGDRAFDNQPNLIHISLPCFGSGEKTYPKMFLCAFIKSVHGGNW